MSNESQSASCKAMRCQARQLDSYSTARHCSTARHTTARHVRSRQNSTARLESSTPRRMQSASTCLDGLDSYSKGSTGKAFDSPSRQRPRRTACVGRRSRPAARQPSAARSSDPEPGLKMRTGSYGVPAAREMSRAMVYGNKKLVVLYTASNALRLLASSQSLRLRAPAPRAEGRSQSAINHRRAAQVVCSSSGGIRVVEQPAAERWQIELNCIHMGTQLCRGTAGRFT